VAGGREDGERLTGVVVDRSKDGLVVVGGGLIVVVDRSHDATGDLDPAGEDGALVCRGDEGAAGDDIQASVESARRHVVAGARQHPLELGSGCGLLHGAELAEVAPPHPRLVVVWHRATIKLSEKMFRKRNHGAAADLETIAGRDSQMQPPSLFGSSFKLMMLSCPTRKSVVPFARIGTQSASWVAFSSGPPR